MLLKSRRVPTSCFCLLLIPLTASAAAPASGFSWSTSTRRPALAAYFDYYLPSNGYLSNMAWTGNLTGFCQPGTVSAAFLEDTQRRINYLRAQAGLTSDISLNSTKNSKSQWAAAVFSTEQAFSHNPALDFPGNPCVIADQAAHGGNGWANEAAQQGNLTIPGIGPAAVDQLILDSGAENEPAGHRRWLLNSRAQEMGVGSVPANGSNVAAACIWANNDLKSTAVAPAVVVTWPNAGFIPYQLVPRQEIGGSDARWSCGFRNANFFSAAVTMKRTVPGPDFAIAVTKEPYATGYGDNTMVWRLDNPADIPAGPPAQDTTYQVDITGITLTSGSPPAGFVSTGGSTYKYTYTTTVFDPYALGEEMVISGPASPPVGTASTYTFPAITGASGYRIISGKLDGTAWTEGAEASPVPRVVSGISGSYTLTTSALAFAGTKSFHLAIPSFAEDGQNFMVDRYILPSGTSRLQFKHRFRWVTTATALQAQITTDDGINWTTLFTRNGDAGSSSGSSSTWETSFQTADIAIPASAQGRLARIRFILNHNNSAYLGTSDDYGAFIDNVTITNSQELTAPVTQNLAAGATSFSFTPSSSGAWGVAGAPKFGEATFFKNSAPLVVTASAGTLTALQSWRQTYFGSPNNTGNGADTFDFDKDGSSNLIEYLFATNPTQASSKPAPLAVQKVAGGYEVSFTPSAGATGVTFALEQSTSMATSSWSALATTNSGGAYKGTLTFPGPKKFARLRVTNSGGL